MTPAPALKSHSYSQKHSLSLAFRFALREMRGGVKGFLIFIGCIALGVAAIAGVNSVSQSITQAMETQGQDLLGGDIRFQLTQRLASPDERAWIESLGSASESATMRSMVRLPDGTDQALVELKAVDAAYPLYNQLDVQPALDHDALFAERDGVHGAAVPQLLLDRMGLTIGDRLQLGTTTFEIRAVILNEPDAVSEGFGFAPRFLISLDGLSASQLMQPGSLVQHAYRVKLTGDTSAARIAAIRAEAEEKFPNAGWTVRTRSNVSPGLTSNVERFSQFLTLIGLTALVVGGVGVANAVRAFLDSKRNVIATFKSLGASGRLVVQIYLIQILAISLIGISIGLVLGIALPFLAGGAVQAVVPVAVTGGLYPAALLLAATYGLLTTLIFALIPLGRARDVPVTALFREFDASNRALPRATYLIAVLGLTTLLSLLAILLADDQRITLTFLGAILVAFIILIGMGSLVRILAQRAPRARSITWQLALGSLHRPGAVTHSVVLSLGLGLTLLAALSMIDGNLRRQISDSLPTVAPNFFFLDIQPQEVDTLEHLVKTQSPDGKLALVPMLRGRITELNGVDIRQITIPAEGGWVLRGDRGITYSDIIPENSRVIDGTWWEPDYQGDPLVSFSAREAQQLGLKIGDTVTVNVLGRLMTAKIANLREVEWETLAMNFVMVFSPNVFAGAPHAWLGTLTDPAASAEKDSQLLNAISKALPTVTAIGVKDALQVAGDLMDQLTTGARMASSITVIASALVFAGALAASTASRIRDNIILKVLGARRQTLIRALVYEYLLLGAATALFALLAGALAAWFVVTKIMKLSWTLMPDVAIATIIGAVLFTVLFGLAATWRSLGQKPAPFLREL